jgi:aspartyl protease family protein
MGVSYIEGRVRGPAGEAAVEFMIDSGAMYSLLPAAIWKAIGLEARRAMEFSLADGSKMRRRISECVVSLPQGEVHSPVILGEPGDDQPLLGVVTLEELALVFDPFRRTLHPMQVLPL